MPVRNLVFVTLVGTLDWFLSRPTNLAQQPSHVPITVRYVKLLLDDLADPRASPDIPSKTIRFCSSFKELGQPLEFPLG